MVSPHPSIYLYFGEESYLKERALEKLRASLRGSSHSDIDYKVFYGGETKAADILEYADTFPFLSQKKLIVIKDFERLSAEERMRVIEHAKRLTKHAVVVIDSCDRKTLAETSPLKRYIKVEDFGAKHGDGLAGWIRDYLLSRGKRVEEDGMDALMELDGARLSYIAGELEKLSAYTGSANLVKRSDVEEVAGKGLARPVFDIVEAVSAGRVERALAISSELTRTGKKVHEIIGVLYWHFGRLLRAKALRDKGEDDSVIANALNINPKHSGGFFRQVGSCDINRLRRQIEILLHADRDAKRSRLNPALSLELAIMRLCLYR
jgi:DNA polymerase-3 subunit delta